jgi:hypothetical protein
MMKEEQKEKNEYKEKKRKICMRKKYEFLKIK